MKVLKILIFLLVMAFAGVVVVSLFMPKSSVTEAEIAVAKSEANCRSNSDMFLYALKHGWSDSEVKSYWDARQNPKSLYGVHDYRFLSSRDAGNKFTDYIYEIDSSTQGGIPVRKRWAVTMEPDANNSKGKECAIVDLSEAE